MKELVIYIDSCYVSARSENIIDCINSIEESIGIEDYSYYIVCNIFHIENLKSVYESLIGDKIFKLVERESNGTWADNFNTFVDDCKNDFRVLLMSHDDLVIDTKDFYNIYLDETKDINPDELGWTTFSNVGYQKQGMLMANSVREGISVDRIGTDKRKTECHTEDVNNLDWPERTCVVWSTFHMLNLISFKNILKFHPLTVLTNWSVLADEDFNLEAMLSGMDNIWIPYVEYQHPLRSKGRVGWGKKTTHRAHGESERNFSKKWGVSWSVRNYTDGDVQFLLNEYPGSRLQKFAGRCSYDYIYLDEYLKEKGESNE